MYPQTFPTLDSLWTELNRLDTRYLRRRARSSRVLRWAGTLFVLSTTGLIATTSSNPAPSSLVRTLSVAFLIAMGGSLLLLVFGLLYHAAAGTAQKKVMKFSERYGVAGLPGEPLPREGEAFEKFLFTQTEAGRIHLMRRESIAIMRVLRVATIALITLLTLAALGKAFKGSFRGTIFLVIGPLALIGAFFPRPLQWMIERTPEGAVLIVQRLTHFVRNSVREVRIDSIDQFFMAGEDLNVRTQPGGRASIDVQELGSGQLATWQFRRLRSAIANALQLPRSAFDEALLSQSDDRFKPPAHTTEAPPLEPSDVSNAALLANIRAGAGDPVRRFSPRELESLIGAGPPKILRLLDDPLLTVFRDARLLLEHGTIVWAAFVQYNRVLAEPGQGDAAAQIIFSIDPWYDTHVSALANIALNLGFMAEAEQQNDADREFMSLITNDRARPQSVRIPESLCPANHPVWISAIWVFRSHLPGRVISSPIMPLLVHPDTSAVMLLPVSVALRNARRTEAVPSAV